MLMLSVAYAADTAQTLVYKINKVIINPLIQVIFAVALIVFLYGVIEYLWSATNKEARAKGRQHMLWGVIGFVIMLGVYGIINILISTFGLKNATINQDKQEIRTQTLPEVRLK